MRQQPRFVLVSFWLYLIMILVRLLTYYVSIHLRRYLNLVFVFVFILSIYYF